MTIDSAESEAESSSEPQEIPKHVTSTSQLEKDEVYFATVDKASGNALIRLDHSDGSHINIGPIDKPAAGKQVKFRYVEGVWGLCLDEEYSYDGYDPKEDGSFSSGHTFPTGYAYSTTDGTITEKSPDNKNKLLKGKL